MLRGPCSSQHVERNRHGLFSAICQFPPPHGKNKMPINKNKNKGIRLTVRYSVDGLQQVSRPPGNSDLAVSTHVRPSSCGPTTPTTACICFVPNQDLKEHNPFHISIRFICILSLCSKHKAGSWESFPDLKTLGKLCVFIL